MDNSIPFSSGGGGMTSGNGLFTNQQCVTAMNSSAVPTCETQYPDSLDMLLQTFENQNSSPYMDEDIGFKMESSNAQSNLCQYNTIRTDSTQSPTVSWTNIFQTQQHQLTMAVAIPSTDPQTGCMTTFVPPFAILSNSTTPKGCQLRTPQPFSVLHVAPNQTFTNTAISQNPSSSVCSMFQGNGNGSFQTMPNLYVSQPTQMQQPSHPSTSPIPSQPTKRLALSSMTTSGSVSSGSLKRKRPTFSCNDSLDKFDVAVSEDEEDKGKRRQDRNQREQLRSQRITDQITDLRDLLKSSNIEFKNDKYSTLVTVDQYIRFLQKQASVLDDEQKKLLNTIAQTTEIVNNQYMPTQDDDLAPLLFDPNDPLGENISPSKLATSPEPSNVTSSLNPSDESLNFIQGINYKFVFDYCPFACSITGSDGRFLDCNEEFLETSGYTRDELFVNQNGIQNEKRTPQPSNQTTQNYGDESEKDDPFSRPPSPGDIVEMNKEPIRNKSLFNVLHKDDIESVFCAMSSMLQFREVLGRDQPDEHDTWVRVVKLSRKDVKSKIRVSLVRSPNGLPRFFNCVLIPLV